MSWKANSTVTAAFAAALVAPVVACDPVAPDPDPEPISVAGVYSYTFEFTNGAEGEDAISCEGQGVIMIAQQADSTFSGETAEGGLVTCSGSGQPAPVPGGLVAMTGEIAGTDLMLQFLPEQDVCDALGTVEGNPVTGLSGTATCLVDAAVLGRSGDPVELTGAWRADRTGG